MKKIISLLLAMCLMFGLAACGDDKLPPDATTDDPTLAPENPEEMKGSVYYLNFKPEADAAWQELAKQYTQETGVPVKVVTAAAGDYATTLNAQMGKSGQPTIFNCGNAMSVADWADYTLDLSNTKLAGELTTTDYNLYDADGALKAIGYCYETFGIIVNTKLLEQAGYKLTDIKDFASLKSIAEDIHSWAEELGFDAFTSSGLDDTSAWRFSGHLANMPLFYEFRDEKVVEQPAALQGTYLNNFRQIWDLYINNSATAPADQITATGDDAKAAFTGEKAVFWQQGSWEYAGLQEAGLTDVAMIPIYCGVPGEENAGLCSGTENCWAVNSKAPQEDIDASLEFLYWVVTSDAGTKMLSEQFGTVPFKNAAEVTNGFSNAAIEMFRDGKYTVTWAFNYTPNVDNWRAGVVTALTAYTADQTDENWQKVVDAFVTGWAIEYNTQNN